MNTINYLFPSKSKEESEEIPNFEQIKRSKSDFILKSTQTENVNIPTDLLSENDAQAENKNQITKQTRRQSLIQTISHSLFPNIQPNSSKQTLSKSSVDNDSSNKNGKLSDSQEIKIPNSDSSFGYSDSEEILMLSSLSSQNSTRFHSEILFPKSYESTNFSQK
jgi:hypothetical protein